MLAFCSLKKTQFFSTYGAEISICQLLRPRPTADPKTLTQTAQALLLTLLSF